MVDIKERGFTGAFFSIAILAMYASLNKFSNIIDEMCIQIQRLKNQKYNFSPLLANVVKQLLSVELQQSYSRSVCCVLYVLRWKSRYRQ